MLFRMKNSVVLSRAISLKNNMANSIIKNKV